MNRREDEGLIQSASERPVREKFSADLKYLHDFFPSLKSVKHQIPQSIVFIVTFSNSCS